MTFARGLFTLSTFISTEFIELSQLKTFLLFCQKQNFAKYQTIVVTSHNATYVIFYSNWESLLIINLMVLLALSWPFRILKLLYSTGQPAFLKEKNF